MWIDESVLEYNHFIMNCLNRKSMTNVFFPVKECIGKKKIIREWTQLGLLVSRSTHLWPALLRTPTVYQICFVSKCQQRNQMQLLLYLILATWSCLHKCFHVCAITQLFKCPLNWSTDCISSTRKWKFLS